MLNHFEMNEKDLLKQYEWDYTMEIRKPIKQGSLILAHPFLRDEGFSRSVCLICSHSMDDGTFGLIINKPLELNMSDLVADLSKVNKPVYKGGPVSSNSLFFIHNNELDISDAQKISDGIYWNGNFDELKEKLFLMPEKAKNVKFLLGYSGWEKGQLKKEIIEDSWIINNNVSTQMIFSNNKNLWKGIMQSMGALYKNLSTLPKNPDYN